MHHKFDFRPRQNSKTPCVASRATIGSFSRRARPNPRRLRPHCRSQPTHSRTATCTSEPDKPSWDRSDYIFGVADEGRVLVLFWGFISRGRNWQIFFASQCSTEIDLLQFTRPDSPPLRTVLARELGVSRPNLYPVT